MIKNGKRILYCSGDFGFIVLAVFMLVAGLAENLFAQGLIAQDRRAFADGLMSRGLIKLALPEYKALADDSSTPELDVVMYRLAECERQVGNLEASEKVCKDLLEKFPQSPMAPRARLTRGLLLLASGKANEAAVQLDELATDIAGDFELSMTALYHAATARESAGNLAKAEARYTGLLTKVASPEATAAVKELGAYAELRIAAIKSLANTQEGYADALKRYTDIASRPFSPRIGAEALYQAAALSYRLGKYDDAVARYRELAAKYPSDERIKDSLLPSAWANYKAGRYADALTAASSVAAKEGPLQLEAAYLKANSLAQTGPFKSAVAAYDTLLALPAIDDQQKSLMRSAKYERILVLFKNGEFEKVLADATQFTDPPDSVVTDFIWLQAQAAEALNDETRAIQFYRMLIEKHPECELAPVASYRYAYQLQKQEAWLEASRSYLFLVSSFPTNSLVPQALFSSGFCNARAGKSAEALRDWNMLIEKYPDDDTVPEALFQKAMEEIRNNMTREAAGSLDALIRASGKHKNARIDEARFWRARICYDTREYQPAEKYLRECLSGHPADEIRHEAEFLLGLTLQALGRYGEAATCFQPLLAGTTRAKFSDDRLAWLSEFQYSRGDFASARDAARELAARSTTKEWIQAANTLAGRAYLALSDTNNAIASYRLAADSVVNTKYSSEAALRLGELLVSLSTAESLAEATDYLNSAIQRASSQELIGIRAKAYYVLAECTEKRGNKEAAARYYMVISLLFDDNTILPKALKKAAALYRELGMKQEAASAEAELMQRFPPSGKEAK